MLVIYYPQRLKSGLSSSRLKPWVFSPAWVIKFRIHAVLILCNEKIFWGLMDYPAKKADIEIKIYGSVVIMY